MIAESASEENEMASEDILALRQELGLLEFIRVNADDYNWSSISDGIRWVSSNPDAVSVNYRQGGLWDNIEDLPYETYLPESQMSVSATADVEDVTVTATHVATGMSDSVTVNVDTCAISSTCSRRLRRRRPRWPTPTATEKESLPIPIKTACWLSMSPAALTATWCSTPAKRRIPTWAPF